MVLTRGGSANHLSDRPGMDSGFPFLPVHLLVDDERRPHTRQPLVRPLHPFYQSNDADYGIIGIDRLNGWTMPGLREHQINVHSKRLGDALARFGCRQAFSGDPSTHARS